MATKQPPTDSNNDNEGRTIVRTLGAEGLTPAEARTHDNYETHELPTDIIEEYTTKKFTPHRYALICRDIAYFTSVVGRGPKRRMGDSPADPGSGMRRSKEGALYMLAKRTEILKNAVEAGLIEITNQQEFHASEGDYRFEITDRGKWYLQQYFGNHIPVHKISHKKISRHSTALNKRSVVIPNTDERAANAIKTYEEYQTQVNNNDPLSDPDTGTYHINPDDRIDSFPSQDPLGKEITTWIRQRDVPAQFDVTQISGNVHLCVDLKEYKTDTFGRPNIIEFILEDGDIYLSPTTERSDIYVSESFSKSGLAIKGDYDPFVSSGAKDALTAAVDASWNDDYKHWRVDAEDVLVGVQAMLETEGVDQFTCPARIVYEFVEHI